MNQTCLLCVWKDWKRLKYFVQVVRSFNGMNPCSARHSVPDLGQRDGGNQNQLVAVRLHPIRHVKLAFFAGKNYVRVDDYRHLLTGAFNILRACLRSRRHSFASSSDHLLSLKSLAQSFAVQSFFSSGTSRATASPFRNNTNVTFWECTRFTQSAKILTASVTLIFI